MVDCAEVLAFANAIIEEENGMRLRTCTTKIGKANLDSFGWTMLLVELDEDYGLISKTAGAEVTLFNSIEYETVTIQDICNMIDKAGIYESN
jgi:hypothetical protein